MINLVIAILVYLTGLSAVALWQAWLMWDNALDVGVFDFVIPVVSAVIYAATALGVVWRKQWARYLVYLIALFFSAAFVYLLVASHSNAWLETRPDQVRAVSVTLVVIVISAFCCYAVYRHYIDLEK